MDFITWTRVTTCGTVAALLCGCSAAGLGVKQGDAVPSTTTQSASKHSVGSVRLQEIPAPSSVTAIAIGPDGNPWFLPSTGGIATYRMGAFQTYPPPAGGNFAGLAPGRNGIFGVQKIQSSQNQQVDNVLSLTRVGGVTKTSPGFSYSSVSTAISMKTDPTTGNVWWGIGDSTRLTSFVIGGPFSGPKVTLALAAENDLFPIAVGAGAAYAFDYQNPMSPTTKRSAAKRRPFIAGGTFVVLKISKATAMVTDAFPAAPIQQVNDMAVDSHGNLWLTDPQNNALWRMRATGVFTKFPLPTLNANPNAIVLGPDSALWFTETQAGKIGRITSDGHLTEYAVRTGMQPDDIAAPAFATGCGPVLWFTENTVDGQTGALGEIILS